MSGEAEAKEDGALVEEGTAWLDAHGDLPYRRRRGGVSWPTRAGPRRTCLRSTAVGRVREIFASYGALRPPGGLGLMLAAPTILMHGTPDPIERHVPPILDGRLAGCQRLSEPGAGSDLAGLSTGAVRDGDRWIISGQRVWRSMALECDYGMLLARTNPDLPKPAGISWFACRLDFVRRALALDCGATWLLPRLVGLQKAKELTFLGDWVGAEEARSLGLVTRTFAQEQLVDAARETALRLAKGPPMALSLIKRGLEMSGTLCFADMLDHEARAQAVCTATHDFAEGMKAFVERREPEFSGG